MPPSWQHLRSHRPGAHHGAVHRPRQEAPRGQSQPSSHYRHRPPDRHLPASPACKWLLGERLGLNCFLSGVCLGAQTRLSQPTGKDAFIQVHTRGLDTDGQSPTPSHPLGCLPEESFAMKEQAPPRTGEIGAQAESLHRRQPARGPQPRVRRWLSQAIPFSLQTSVCPTKKGGAWGRPPPHPHRGQSGSDHYSLTPE